jgi:homoserine dehydrogenase
MNIAILGMGNIGQGVIKILNENNDEITKRCGEKIVVKKVLVKNLNKKREVQLEDGVLTETFDDILQDDSIKIVIELIGGLEPAKTYMLKSMKAKKHVVTANKLAIAEEGEELFDESEASDVSFNYEASVCGGIPIINGINTSLTANRIQKIFGIINGTTNYILTKMSKDECSFEKALKEAQDLGYAEADPTSDVEGYDAMYKLSILSRIAFGFKTKNIYREGITKIKPIDIKYAKEFGYIIKMLAIAREHGGRLELRVHPTMIPLNHPLANVNDSFNAVLINGNAVGDLMFYGRGAGDLPTGSAVISDIISIINNMNSQFTNKNMLVDRNLSLKSIHDVECEYYIRIMVKDQYGVLANITTIFASNKVSILSVIQKADRKDNNVNLVFITHRAKGSSIRKSLLEIEASDEVNSVRNVIRIEK